MTPYEPSTFGQRPTIQDIAAEAGVSTATVSRVLNGSAFVGPKTRAAVIEAMERRRFVGRRQRRLPAGGTFIMVRCPYVLTDYFGLLLWSVAQSLHQHGKRVLLSVEERDSNVLDLSELLMSRMTEGAILILPPESSDVLTDLRDRNYPFVVLDTRAPVPAHVASVSAAHMAGGRAATAHLLALGHERIGIICGPPDWRSADGRLAGYRSALAEVGKLAPPELVRVGGQPTVDNGLRAARDLLDLPQRPTAVIAYNDKMAVGAMQAAAERGLEVPKDLSLVGFDGFELGQAVEPQLTTVRQPIAEMARISVELLMRLIERREIETMQVVLATELVVGASSGPPRRTR